MKKVRATFGFELEIDLEEDREYSTQEIEDLIWKKFEEIELAQQEYQFLDYEVNTCF